MFDDKQIDNSKLFFSTDRLNIRGFAEKDYKNVQSAIASCSASQNEFAYLNPILHLVSEADFATRVAKHKTRMSDKSVFTFGVFLKENDQFIGMIDLRVIVASLRWMNIGYEILNPFWHKGYGLEAVTGLLNHALTEMNIHRIEAAIDVRNLDSIKLIEKTPMLFEGIRRNFFPGKIADFAIYGMNAVDFANIG